MADSINLQLGRHAVNLAEEEWGTAVPKSLDSAFRDLISEQGHVCLVAGDWYVCSIEPRHEELAKGEVVKHGLVPYLPLCPRRERHGRGAERTMWRPMFGSYMFVRFDLTEDNWNRIRAARGVRRLLGCEGKPMPVDDGLIEAIRLYEAEEVEKERLRGVVEEAAVKARAGGKSGLIWHFTAGERVRIKNGPFANFYAELESAVDDHDRIKALVNYFGRKSSTELSAFDIEAI